MIGRSGQQARHPHPYIYTSVIHTKRDSLIGHLPQQRVHRTEKKRKYTYSYKYVTYLHKYLVLGVLEYYISLDCHTYCLIYYCYMEPIHNKRRITITLDNAVFDKLPKRDRSAFINLVLKQHFQKEGFEQLYGALKKRLMVDKDMNDWIVLTVRETR